MSPNIIDIRQLLLEITIFLFLVELTGTTILTIYTFLIQVCCPEILLTLIVTATWICAKTHGAAPSPRSGHSCVLYGTNTLFVFGGGNDSKLFNDLYSLNIGTFSCSLFNTNRFHDMAKSSYKRHNRTSQTHTS
jgi:hypothetical protein